MQEPDVPTAPLIDHRHQFCADKVEPSVFQNHSFLSVLLLAVIQSPSAGNRGQ